MDLDRMNPVVPVAKHPDHAIRFLDLFTACQSFAVDVEQVVSRLRDRRLSGGQRAVIRLYIARTRAVLKALETAMDAGAIDGDVEFTPALPRT